MERVQMFNSLPAQAQKALRELSDAVIGFLPTDMRSWSISTANLVPGAKTVPLVAEVKKWKGCDIAFLYFFRLTNNVDLEEVECAYADAKAHRTNERAYSRLMASSTYLYVGRSQNISQRLKEHLGCQVFVIKLPHTIFGEALFRIPGRRTGNETESGFSKPLKD